MDLAFPVDHRVTLKESEKKDKYLNLDRELKKLWNRKVTIIPIVIGALVTVTSGLIKERQKLKIRGPAENVNEILKYFCSMSLNKLSKGNACVCIISMMCIIVVID